MKQLTGTILVDSSVSVAGQYEDIEAEVGIFFLMIDIVATAINMMVASAFVSSVLQSKAARLLKCS